MSHCLTICMYLYRFETFQTYNYNIFKHALYPTISHNYQFIATLPSMEPSAVAREGAQLLTTTYNDQVWLLWSLLDVLINIREERERKQSRLTLTGARGLLTCFYWLGTCSPPVSPGTEYYQVPQWTVVDSSTTTTTTACTDITRQTTNKVSSDSFLGVVSSRHSHIATLWSFQL